MIESNLPTVHAPTSREVRAYILDLVAELAELAQAHNFAGLSGDLEKVALAHKADARGDGHG